MARGRPCSSFSGEIPTGSYRASPLTSFADRKQFSWNEETFGKYVALFGIVGLFTQYVAVPFLTERGYHDTTLGFWGVVGSTAQCVITALAKCVRSVTCSCYPILPHILFL